MGTIFDSIILRQILVETTSTRTPITPTQKQRNNNFEAQVNFQCNAIVWHKILPLLKRSRRLLVPPPSL